MWKEAGALLHKRTKSAALALSGTWISNNSNDFRDAAFLFFFLIAISACCYHNFDRYFYPLSSMFEATGMGIVKARGLLAKAYVGKAARTRAHAVHLVEIILGGV